MQLTKVITFIEKYTPPPVGSCSSAIAVRAAVNDKLAEVCTVVKLGTLPPDGDFQTFSKYNM